MKYDKDKRVNCDTLFFLTLFLSQFLSIVWLIKSRDMPNYMINNRNQFGNKESI